jgi:hypothetical protein
MSLPWLEAMGPVVAWADNATPQSAPPNRMAFVYVPNGKNMDDWTPKQDGADFELPAILQPLTPVKDKLTVLTGLTADKARPHGDGGGDHARRRPAVGDLAPLAREQDVGHRLRAGQAPDVRREDAIGARPHR